MKSPKELARVTAFAAAAALTTVAFTPLAAAQNDYTSQVTVTHSVAIAPGVVVTISGDALAGEIVTVYVDGVQIASYTVGTGFNPQQAQPTAIPYSFDVTIPSNLSNGTHTLSVAVGGTQVSTSNFVVGQTSTADTDPALAVTGGESAPLALGAVGMIAAGASLLVVRRKTETA